jgi:hypothetical protein
LKIHGVNLNKKQLLVLGLMHFLSWGKCYTCFRFGVCWKGVLSIVLRVFDPKKLKARTPATLGDHIDFISLHNQVISRASRVPRDNFTLHLQTPSKPTEIMVLLLSAYYVFSHQLAYCILLDECIIEWLIFGK